MARIIFLLISVLLFWTNQTIVCGPAGCIRGEGEIKSEVRHLSGFTEIDLSGSPDVIVKSGNEYKVVVKDYENLLPKLKTVVKGNALKIYFDGCVTNSQAVVEITMPELTGIRSSGSGDIRVSGDFKGDYVNVAVSGSGNVTFNGLIDGMQSLEIAIAGSGDVHFNSVVKEAKVKTSVLGSGDVSLNLPGKIADFELKSQGSGDVYISGDTVANAQMVTMGSGDISAENVVFVNARVKTMGSGDIKLQVRQSLEATTMGSGDIIYSGNPQKISLHAMGSGDVRKM